MYVHAKFERLSQFLSWHNHLSFITETVYHEINVDVPSKMISLFRLLSLIYL